MDNHVFEQAKQEISEGINELMANDNEAIKELVKKNTIEFMERMRMIDDRLLKGELNDEDARKEITLDKHAYESMLYAQKILKKEHARRVLTNVVKKLVEIAVTQVLKALLLAL